MRHGLVQKSENMEKLHPREVKRGGVVDTKVQSEGGQS